MTISMYCDKIIAKDKLEFIEKLGEYLWKKLK